VLTLPIREVVTATPRARIVRIGVAPHPFSYLPGQAVFVGAPGRGKRRPYSIASSPEETERYGHLELLVGVDAAGSPGTHLTLEPGAELDVDGPIGRFTFPTAPTERRFLFIAGGTGIAPLRAMLQHALHVDHDSIGLLYSARTASEFAYEQELNGLASQGLIEFRQTVTRDGVVENWGGGRGRIDRAILESLVHDPATLSFVCGPPALVAEMPKLLVALGVPGEKVRVEEF
jgi:ferredoxin-NADP reductase